MSTAELNAARQRYLHRYGWSAYHRALWDTAVDVPVSAVAAFLNEMLDLPGLPLVATGSVITF
ncbi:hypothetical protein [Streptomyces misionensis]|uniref:hypothetical protein n=1 Tax=Streptomyces misionensis TaxID=67331 RepID=UPI003692216A